MATNIDERIVAAKFDASDFEKGVDKTIKKLDDLKKSLDLKDATKGVQEFAEKTEASTDSMSKSLEKLTDRFTTFTGMIKQKILSGLADEVAGVFFKMEQSVKSFIKSISSDQVGAGMQKYEQMLTSVRIMMSAGETENSAYKAIGTLRDYSDQTSYSLSQMTDALSKLRAAGVDLDTATKSVEGIANACANAGINATDAQRAFYNLSQAYSSGVLKYTDYRSLELLNMTTSDFKDKILEAAEAAGTLKKVSDGVYQTINKNNKKVTAGKKVTAQNLQDMLRYNFVTSDVMNELFGGKFFFDEQKFKEYKKKYNSLDEAIQAAKKDYGETAVNAYLAAREARSFTDVVNTLKDVVSTGWSTTFEHLFGKLEEAKDFFTNLAEGELAEVIYKIGEYRNALLGYWDDLDAEGNGSGGKVLRESILNITDAIGILFKTFQQILPGFDELNNEEDEAQPILESLGDKLFEISMSFRDFTDRIKEGAENFNKFMNSPIMVNGPTRIEAIRETLKNLSTIFGVIGKVVVIAFNAVTKAFYSLYPIMDGFLILLTKVTEPLVSLKDNTQVFKDVEHSIDNIFTVLEPVAKVLGNIIGFLGEVGAFFASMAIDTVTSNITFFSDALGLLVELFTGKSAQMKDGEGVLAKIRSDFEGIKEACTSGLSAVNEFFGTLLGDIRKLLGLTDEAEDKFENQNGGIFSGIINFFNTNKFVQDAKKWVNQAITDVGNLIKSIPERIAKLGANIYDTIWHLFFYEKREDVGGEMRNNIYKTELGEWLDKVIKDIKEFFITLPDKIVKGVGKVGDWIDEIFDSWFGEKASSGSTDNQKLVDDVTGKDSAIMSRFENFVEATKKTIADWFNDLPNKIRTAFKSVGNFVTNLYNAIDEFLFGKKTMKITKVMDKDGNFQTKTIAVRYKKGFSKWLDGVIKEIRKFINNIPEYIKAGIKGAGDIISTVVSTIFGKPEGSEVTNKDVEEKLSKPFEGVNISNILNTIKEIGKEIINQIARIFTGNEDIDYNMNWFAEKIGEGIEWIRTNASRALTWVLDFLVDIPTKIASIFTGEDKQNADKGPIGQAILNFGETVGTFITVTLPGKITEMIDNAIDAFDKIWTTLYDKIINGSKEKSEEAASDATEAIAKGTKVSADFVPSAWEQFVMNIGQTLAHIWEELPVWIAEGIEMAIVAIDSILNNLGEWIAGLPVKNEISDSAEEATESAIDGMAKSTTEGADKEKPRLLEAIEKIGERIKELFVTTIPTFVQNAWTEISKMGSELFEGFSAIFTGQTPNSEIGNAVKTFGENIYSFIVNDVPKALQKAFSFISELIKGKEEDTWKKNIVVTGSMYNDIAKEVENQQNQAKKRMGSKNQSGFWGFAESLKNSFINAFESIGPTVLNGIAKALEWMSDIATIIIDAISGKKSIGEQVEDAYGKKQPELRAALTRIGEALKNFFLDTVPKLIGSAIAALTKQAPDWFAKLFGAMSASAEEESKEAFEGVGGSHSFGNAVTNAMSAMDIVKTIYNELKAFIGENKEFLEIMGVLIALSMVFSRLSDLFGIADELDSGAKTVKWTAIALAVVAITGIMNAITSIVNSGDPQKVEDFNNIIERLGDMFKTLAWVIGLLSIGKIADALGNKWEGGSGKVSLGEKILGGLSDALTGFFEAVGTGAGVYVGASFAGAGIENALSSISDGFVTLTSAIDDALSLIAPFVDTLNAMNTKLDTATAAANKIRELFSAFFNTFTELYTEIYGYQMKDNSSKNANAMASNVLTDANGKMVKAGPVKEILSMSAFLDELSQRLDLFNQLSVFIDQIASSINKLEGITNIQEKVDNLSSVLTNGSFGSFMTSLLNLLNQSIIDSNLDPKKLGTTTYIMERNSGIALAFDVLASSLSIFANSVAGLNESDIGALDRALGVFRSLYDTLGDKKVKDNTLFKAFLGSNSLSKVGSEIKLFGIDMKSFFNAIRDITGFSESEVDETNRKIDAVVNIALQFARVIDDLSTSNGFATGLMEEMGEKLPAFGEKVGKFFLGLNDVLDSGGNLTKDKAEVLFTATKTMAELMSSLRDLSAILEFKGGQEQISEMMNSMFTGMDGDINAGKFAAMIRVFDEAVSRVMKDDSFGESYREIGNGIAGKLAGGIQSAFDEDPSLQIKITPVLNMSDEVKQKLRDQLTTSIPFDGTSLFNSVVGANNYTDADRVKSSELYSKIGEVTTSIDSLKNSQVSVNDIINAFLNIRIVTDTGVLAGEMTDKIDELIGQKIWLIEKGVTP